MIDTTLHNSALYIYICVFIFNYVCTTYCSHESHRLSETQEQKDSRRQRNKER